MKKSLITYAMVAAVSFGFMGCSQDETAGDGTNVNKQTITFVSGDETTPTTRTSMGGAYTDTNFPFYWEAGDAIWVNAKDKITGSNTGTASYALFTGSVTTSAPYKIRYTGTGSYNTTSTITGNISTTSNATTLVIPPVQAMTEAQLGTTTHFGANGDCGTATATGSGTSYSFKLDHKAAYLILMPRWTGNDGTYKLKSVTVTTHNNSYLLSGRFSFSDTGIGAVATNTNGSSTIKITTGGSDGIVLPTATDQAKSINIAIKPVASTSASLYCIYEVSHGTDTYYIEKIISGKSFNVNTVTPITADIKAGYDAAVNNPTANGGSYLDLITNNNPYSGFYEWDAPVGEEYFVSHEMGDNYNATTVNSDPTTDFTNVASASCKNCPTYNQISWYIKGGCYWDANKKWGPADKQKGGMWFKKKEYLFSSGVVTESNFSSTVSPAIPIKTTPVTTAPDGFSTSNWFFLPAGGIYQNGVLGDGGLGYYGYYWSNQPKASGNACFLCFDINTAYIEVNLADRHYGDFLWTAQ